MIDCKKLLDVQPTSASACSWPTHQYRFDPFRHRIVLDAGTAQSIVVGQPVLDARDHGPDCRGYAGTSVAMLVTDPSHAIPVMIERTGLRTIAYGNGAIDQSAVAERTHER